MVVFTVVQAVFLGMLVGAVGLPILSYIVVCCLGFCRGGIRSGSTAACCMSYDAVRHGGGVESDGCVACCQGLGECERRRCCTLVSVMFVLGAVAGGAIGGVVAKHIQDGQGLDNWSSTVYINPTQDYQPRVTAGLSFGK